MKQQTLVEVHNMASDVQDYEAQIRNCLAGLEKGAWQANAELSYWDRGGPPGPRYESNYLQVIGKPQSVLIRYTKTRFNPEKPPYRVSIFEGAGADVLPVLRDELLRRTPFSKRYAEEQAVSIGDVTKFTLSVTDGILQTSKTMYKALPQDLAVTDSLFRSLMAMCEASGKQVNQERKGDNAT